MEAFEMSWNLLRKAWYDSVDDRHREQPFDRESDFPPYTPLDDYDEVPEDDFSNMPRDKLVAMVRRMMQEKEM